MRRKYIEKLVLKGYVMQRLCRTLCAICVVSISGVVLGTETITYIPGGEFPPNPEDYVICPCEMCHLDPPSEQVGYKKRIITEIDITPVQTVGDTINCAEDLRCQANDVDKVTTVVIEAGSEYTYSVAHWWEVNAEIDVVDDLIGFTLGCGGENSEAWTCTTCVGTQTPVDVHVEAGTWDDPKMKWTVYQVDYAVDDYFYSGPFFEDWTAHASWSETGYKKQRSLMGSAANNVLSTSCEHGVECWIDCPPCGTIGSVSGPCTGHDCPNMLCSHHY